MEAMIIPPRKTEADSTIRRIEAPSMVRVSCEGLVVLPRPGDSVAAGDVLARSPRGASLQRRLHSPLTGTVRIENSQTVIVEGEWPSSLPTEHHDDPGQWEADEIINRALEAGLLGMGGGMFPTYLKLGSGKPMDHVIVNGCEGEPYLSCDHRVLTEHRQEVECGMRLAMRATGAAKGHIVSKEPNYLAGYERFLIEATLGRNVPDGRSPLDVGVMVINAQTARALHQAVCGRKPLTERVITVAGDAVGRPGNYLVPLGTTVDHILEVCDYDAGRTERLVAGGPMMGREVDLDSAVKAGTGGILALGRKEARRATESACIRCGRCIEACPLALPVTGLIQEPVSEAVLRCIECGICQYVCPARLSLVPRLRAAKTDYQLRQCQ
ncbi:MAG: 4Fe-4S dicluster domain-containing protein [Planctomycetota bacterium]|jgi:electron transport complex protein RnfC|nr:4Fe-4S dicluster domain-containing protein [Planctomycetota bacterium]